jgi:hypothetical protein
VRPRHVDARSKAELGFEFGILFDPAFLLIFFPHPVAKNGRQGWGTRTHGGILIHPQLGEIAVVDGRLLQGPEQARGLFALHQTGGQSAGHVLHRHLHGVQVVERGQVEAIGNAPGNGPRHADALAAQPQMAVAETAVAQRRALAVEAALHEVVAVQGGFADDLVSLLVIIPTEGFSPSGGICGLFLRIHRCGCVLLCDYFNFTF